MAAAPALASADRSARRNQSQFHSSAHPATTRRSSERTRREGRPDVRVVRGTRSQSAPSDRLVVVAKMVFFCVVVFALIGFVRVTISSVSYGVASQTSELRSQITAMESESSTLSIQKSLVASPSNLRNEATSLGMSPAENTETIKLADDVVKLDAAGKLSLASSLAAVAAEG